MRKPKKLSSPNRQHEDAHGAQAGGIGVAVAGPRQALQLKLQEMADNSPRVRQLSAMQARTDNSKVVQMARTETDNKITYETQDFTYKKETKPRERVSKVTIRGKNRANHSKPETAASFFHGETEFSEDMEGYHKGHVAARQFGGTHRFYNIVPMIANYNTGPWKVVENKIRKNLGRKTVVIEPNYGTVDKRVPTDFDVTIGSKTTNHEHEVEEGEPMSEKEYKKIRRLSRKKVHRDHAKEELSHMLGKKGVPDNFEKMPYFDLDVALLSGEWGKGTIGGRMNFNQWQRQVILSYNRYRNDGLLMSDSQNDPNDELSENGGLERPEIDHFVPKLSGGSNAFSNARTISWEQNNRAERNKDHREKRVREGRDFKPPKPRKKVKR